MHIINQFVDTYPMSISENERMYAYNEPFVDTNPLSISENERMHAYNKPICRYEPLFDGDGAHVFVEHVGAGEIESAAVILIFRHQTDIQTPV